MSISKECRLFLALEVVKSSLRSAKIAAAELRDDGPKELSGEFDEIVFYTSGLLEGLRDVEIKVPKKGSK